MRELTPFFSREAVHDWRTATPVDFEGDPFEPAVQFAEYEGYAVLETEVLIDESWYNKCRLKLEYWPDAVKKLDLKMCPVANGGNYQWTEDDGWIL